MSFPPDPDESSVLPGILAGGGAYLLGIAVIVGAGFGGLSPGTGVWERSAAGIGYLLVHIAAHLPVWQFTIQWTMLPYTAILAIVLVLAGFVVAERGGSHARTPFLTGSVVALGYFPLMLAGSIVLVVGHGAVTPIRMVAPAVLVGGCFPALFGGLGGLLSDSGKKGDAA